MATRTSQKQVNKLLSEIRTGIGARTNAVAWQHIEQARLSLARRLERNGFNGVTLSPYANNAWTLSAWGVGTHSGVAWCSAITSA